MCCIITCTSHFGRKHTVGYELDHSSFFVYPNISCFLRNSRVSTLGIILWHFRDYSNFFIVSVTGNYNIEKISEIVIQRFLEQEVVTYTIFLRKPSKQNN